MLATATRTPNLSISGSFWNCGAPPDRVMTVAMLSAVRTEATIVAANVAHQSSTPGWEPSRCDRRANTESATTAVIAKLLTLNRILSGDWRETKTSAGDRAEQERTEVVGRAEEEEADYGRDLAQRERVGLPPEVDLDDLRLGQEEAQRDDRPGHVDGGRDQHPAVEDAHVEHDRRDRQEHAERPHAGRHGHRHEGSANDGRWRPPGLAERVQLRPAKIADRGPADRVAHGASQLVSTA